MDTLLADHRLQKLQVHQQWQQNFPLMVLLDISMPNVRGIEAVTEVRRSQPGVKVLMLTMHNNKEYLYAAIAAGADGYLLKENSDDELLAAIDQVMLGETYISSTLAADFSEDLMKFYRKNKNCRSST